MRETNEAIKDNNPVELLQSIIYTECNKCGIEHPSDEKCPKCGSSVGFLIFKSGDCTNCDSFRTDGFAYPSGKCIKHNILVGIKEYCKDFKTT